MTNHSPRDAFMPCLIAVLCVGAAQYFFVQPASRLLAHERDRASSLRASALALDPPTSDQIDKLAAVARHARNLQKSFAQQSALELDATQLLESLTHSAYHLQVSIDRFRPEPPTPVKPTPVKPASAASPQAASPQTQPPAPAADAPPGTPDSITIVHLNISGSYSSLTSFLTLLQHDLGLCKVHALRLQPQPGSPGDAAAAQLELHFFHFSPSSPAAPPSIPRPGSSATGDTP